MAASICLEETGREMCSVSPRMKCYFREQMSRIVGSAMSGPSATQMASWRKYLHARSQKFVIPVALWSARARTGALLAQVLGDVGTLPSLPQGLLSPEIRHSSHRVFRTRDDDMGSSSIVRRAWLGFRVKWKPTPVFLPGESQGRRSLVGCHLWGRTESNTTEAT